MTERKYGLRNPNVSVFGTQMLTSANSRSFLLAFPAGYAVLILRIFAA